MPLREQNSNKGTFGKVLNICGSKKYTGAAYLATVSSLKVGAGFSALAGTKNVIDMVSKLLPEAVCIDRKEALKNLNVYNVILLGCGLGKDFRAKIYFNKVMRKIKTATMPVIIDADGLNLLSEKPQILNERFIITPHPLEAARLLKCNIDEVLRDTEFSAKKLAEMFKCTVVLKTHRTVICSDKLEIFINQNGNSALAKAGTGDVLAGMIAGLLAQGMSCFEAGKLGVYLHSRCGEIASETLTEYSVMASDLVKYLPEVIKELN